MIKLIGRRKFWYAGGMLALALALASIVLVENARADEGCCVSNQFSCDLALGEECTYPSGVGTICFTKSGPYGCPIEP